jgi:hypothetical protein
MTSDYYDSENDGWRKRIAAFNAGDPRGLKAVNMEYTHDDTGMVLIERAFEQPRTPKGHWREHAFTAATLKERKFDPISFVVPMLIPTGLTILAGRPKIGKSWMVLDIALAKAGGRYVLGDTHLTETDVLYAALEDNDRRLRSRIERILTQHAAVWPERLTLATTWRRLR